MNELAANIPAKERRDAENAHGEQRFCFNLKGGTMNLFRFV